MSEPWRLDPWPPCGKHVFLSHVREDREKLAIPLARVLEQRRVITWGDFKDGRSQDWSRPLDRLRRELVSCRHVVYLLTEAALRQGRGWLAAERAIADHLQQLLSFSNRNLFDVELVLRFPEVDRIGGVDSLIDESVWHPLMSTHTRRISSTDPAAQVEQAADCILEFIQKQVDRGRAISPDLLDCLDHELGTDPDYLARLNGSSLEILG